MKISAEKAKANGNVNSIVNAPQTPPVVVKNANKKVNNAAAAVVNGSPSKKEAVNAANSAAAAANSAANVAAVVAPASESAAVASEAAEQANASANAAAVAPTAAAANEHAANAVEQAAVAVNNAAVTVEVNGKKYKVEEVKGGRRSRRHKTHRKSYRGGNKPINNLQPKKSWSALFKKAPAAPAFGNIPLPPPLVLERHNGVVGGKKRKTHRRKSHHRKSHHRKSRRN
jgi:hypothetical protein